MQVGVDETGDEREARHIHHLAPFIGSTDPRDGVTADRHIAGDQIARHHIEHLPAAQNNIGRRIAARLRDEIGEGDFGHGKSFSSQETSKPGARPVLSW
jgi:hypothetical protein